MQPQRWHKRWEGGLERRGLAAPPSLVRVAGDALPFDYPVARRFPESFYTEFHAKPEAETATTLVSTRGAAGVALSCGSRVSESLARPSRARR